MAVFVAASDETNGGKSLYHYAGWVMPETDWYQFFTPAWQQRVLDGPPKIPYLHMTEMRSRAWREKYGITELNMDDRLDEAAIVIDHMGSLYPLKITIDTSVFSPMFKDFKMQSDSGGNKKYQPDFFAFTAYAFAVLLHLHYHYPEAEKIDFLVENNSDITKYIHQLYKSLPAACTHVGRPELVSVMGEFLPAGKERIPVQAADYLCWHSQRKEAGTLDERDMRRWNTIASRKGFDYTVPTEVLTQLAEAYAKQEKENEAANGIRNVRSKHAETNPSSAQRDKGQTGRGEKSKKAKA